MHPLGRLGWISEISPAGVGKLGVVGGSNGVMDFGAFGFFQSELSPGDPEIKSSPGPDSFCLGVIWIESLEWAVRTPRLATMTPEFQCFTSIV